MVSSARVGLMGARRGHTVSSCDRAGLAHGVRIGLPNLATLPRVLKQISAIQPEVQLMMWPAFAQQRTAHDGESV